MNYILEIKAFYDWLELNPLPSPSISLWYALMHIANKTGWQQEFTVAISVLEIKTGLNAKAIERARNALMQSGRIEWKKRGGNRAAVYKINSLCDKNEYIMSDKVSVNVSHSPSDTPSHSMSALNKQNKTKPKPIKKNKKESEVLYFPNDLLLDNAFKEFAKHRKEMKKPMTDTAISRMLKKLQEVNSEIAVKALNKSIENSWQGVFLEKEMEGAKNERSGPDTKKDDGIREQWGGAKINFTGFDDLQ